MKFVMRSRNLMIDIANSNGYGLKSASSSNPLSRRLRAFATVTALTHGLATGLAQRTAVDARGGDSPAWGDKFWLALDPSMFYHGHSRVYLELHTKHFLVGQSLLGWCQIPAADVIDGLVQVGSLRHLSYRLREKDGSRGHGVVNVAVRVEGSFFQGVHFPLPQRASLYSDMAITPLEEENEPVIGIPVVRW
nr:BON1-associated protein 2-like [Ipomoea batatas]GMD00455.1 BON1-associated protein 2-like [Ipomoea batatas]GMD75134.1 BON1-associated protein 2-like [Ipomoea batatas]GMD79979.1 BON1-associated protein 2-like [Ipomoea batatas]